MKTNIVLVGFLRELTKQIGKKLALDFGLYYADVEEMLEYNLMNEKEIEELCGIDYLNGLKAKVIKDLSNYENSLITMPYSIFVSNNNYDLFKPNCTIVFLEFSKEQLKEKIKEIKDKKEKKEKEVFLLAYDERNEICNENSDISIQVPKVDFEIVYKMVSKQLNQYFL